MVLEVTGRCCPLQIDRLRDPSYRLVAQTQHLDGLLHRR
jgi:hypothetical protein